MQVEDIIKIDIDKSSLQGYQSGYFNSCCFICNGGSNFGFFNVGDLDDVESLGFTTNSPAYQFASKFFAQQQPNVRLFLQVKEQSQSYYEAFKGSDVSQYYFVSIESKQIEEIIDFNNRISNEVKLQFFSTELNVEEYVTGKKIVWWQNQEAVKNRYILSSLQYPPEFVDNIQSEYQVVGATLVDAYNRLVNHEVDDANLVSGRFDHDPLASSYEFVSVSVQSPLNILANYEVDRDLVNGRFDENHITSTYQVVSSKIQDSLIRSDLQTDTLSCSYEVLGASIKDSKVDNLTDESVNTTYEVVEVKMTNLEFNDFTAPFDITYEVIF